MHPTYSEEAVPLASANPSIPTPLGATRTELSNQQWHHQQDRWAQGCQAIFAGFVASAHLQNMRPTISAFGGTPQYDIILSTLKCIGTVDAAKKEERPEDAGMVGIDEGWMKVLSDVLKREDNRYTSATNPTAPNSLTSAVKVEDQEWGLTSRGKMLFRTREDGMVASPQHALPKWWNM